ncbi:MAG: deoxyribodipyrimidine photolyase [Flavobacteriia bacterium]|nr:MAG: deoxyribodipyrimidine photolyase [Flavobacteriia bacterium]
MERPKVSVFWFRRDLRMEDNHGLSKALNSDYPVLPVFIFDPNIIQELKPDDARISFIYERLTALNENLKTKSGSLYVVKDTPEQTWQQLLKTYEVKAVFFNEDYEPYAIQRDKTIKQLLTDAGIDVQIVKDQVIFAKDEILKADGTPYTVYTPYKNKWMQAFRDVDLTSFAPETVPNFYTGNFRLPALADIGFTPSDIKVRAYSLDHLEVYESVRDIPSLNQTSHLSPHLRFGTVSIRQVVKKALKHQPFLNELIWREFFMQILYHFPAVVHANFRRKYDHIKWRNNEDEFERWKRGETGYPMVDAGMRQLHATGYMHNRVRMITAGFLCKHLLIDWRWGEAYFAEKLLDYELASNNGNWQWAAGTGCDAAPYFRVFNPTTQIKKFDKDLRYIKQWVPELESLTYPAPIVDHKMARARAIRTYKEGIQ